MKQTPTTENPFRSDPELVGHLDRLGRIKTYKRFQGWKRSFLQSLDAFFARPGIGPAQKASDSFLQTMKDMKKHVDRCNTMIEKGDLTNDKVTVKGRNSLNELVKHLTIATEDTVAFVPGTKMDERRCGYNKFELGAVLVRDGFSCFDTQQYLNESVTTMGQDKLNHVADRQQLDAFEYYSKKFQNFCDIMADLGLYELMLASRKFANPPDHDEPDMIEITVQCSNGNTVALEIDASETIGKVKETIAEECGIPPAEQILKFKGTKLDDDNATLDECGIEDESVLTVEPPSISITVNQLDGSKVKLDIDPRQPIKEIKKKLQDATGIPVDNQALFDNGTELDDDARPAMDYNIQEGCELDLEPKLIKVFVATPDGITIPMSVKLSDTVGNIKHEVEKQTGIPHHKQIVSYKDKEFSNSNQDNQSVKELGIQDGDNLSVKLAKIPISVNTLDGRTIEIMIDPEDETMDEIKKRLESDTGLPAQKINLYINGTELDDDSKTPKDYEIVAGAILDMVRLIYFIDEDTGALGKLPVSKIVGGVDTIASLGATKGNQAYANLKQRVLQLVD